MWWSSWHQKLKMKTSLISLYTTTCFNNKASMLFTVRHSPSCRWK
jgi:hypothetical protein